MIPNTEHAVTNHLYTLHTACVSWQGFQEASNTTTLLAPTKLIPREPALVDTRNKWMLGFELYSLINFSRSSADVLPSKPEKDTNNK